jgi:hypothetical protein
MGLAAGLLPRLETRMDTFLAEVDPILSLVEDDIRMDRLREARVTLDGMTRALDEGLEALGEVARVAGAYRQERNGYLILQGYLLAVCEALERDDGRLALDRLMESRIVCRRFTERAGAL